ncbi:hypothetical protein ACFVT8_14700 [Lysinibacillus sp. NPDC058147]|uniref:hypothetical protein n=1 Tax=unclassified Lysinibacillus TaxID=2636778 RepID=UPI0036D79F49
MKKYLLFTFTFLLLLTISENAQAADKEKNLPQEFFDEHIKIVIMEELKDQGINYDPSFEIDKIETLLLKESKTNSKKESALNTIRKFKEFDYVYLSEDGKVYSSKRGYLGEAEKTEIDANNTPNSNNISTLSMSNPTVSEIHGGSSGAFERKQLNFSGFDGIISNLTLPNITDVTSGEQPWVYYGFDSSQGGIEGGYSYQTGTKRWLPYIRNKESGLLYADAAYVKYDGNTINNFKFYIKKQTGATYFTAYLVDGANTVKFASTPFTNASTVSVKRNTTIAKDNFNGSNIYTRSLNQKWDNVQVSKYDSDYYYPWSNYPEYSEWKNGQWYGTIDCLNTYIKRSSGYTSIYK